MKKSPWLAGLCVFSTAVFAGGHEGEADKAGGEEWALSGMPLTETAKKLIAKAAPMCVASMKRAEKFHLNREHAEKVRKTWGDFKGKIKGAYNWGAEKANEGIEKLTKKEDAIKKVDDDGYTPNKEDFLLGIDVCNFEEVVKAVCSDTAQTLVNPTLSAEKGPAFDAAMQNMGKVFNEAIFTLRPTDPKKHEIEIRNFMEMKVKDGKVTAINGGRMGFGNTLRYAGDADSHVMSAVLESYYPGYSDISKDGRVTLCERAK